MRKWVKRFLFAVMIAAVLFIAAMVLWIVLDYGGFKAFIAG